MSLSRRRFLGLAGGVLGGLAVGSALPGCSAQTAEPHTGEPQTGQQVLRSARLPRRFQVPLPIPPLAQPVDTSGGVDRYQIVQRSAEVEILPGLQTPIMSYDGSFPGPTIVSRSGRPTLVTHVNSLAVPTVVHLHGGHTPADSDGFPIDFVLPESGQWPQDGGSGQVVTGSRDYEYPMLQRAATLWYHDHRMDYTGASIYRGLAGFHLVYDDEDDALPLPKGERDIPLMIVDRAFDEDGALRYPALDPTMTDRPGVTEQYMDGVMGDVILVNGAPWPVLEVAAARYRFRLLNASNARRYELTLSPSPPRGLVQVGSDGGLLAQPVDLPSIQIAPAERFEVVVDFSSYAAGTEVTLVNRLGSGSTDAVLRFRVSGPASDDSTIPSRLSDVEPLTPPVEVTRQFRFIRGDIGGMVGWTVDGKPYDPDRIDATPPLDTVERWRFSADAYHPVHVHLDPFQVVQRGASQRGPYDAGWKDTVDLSPGETVDVAIRFRDYAGRYVLHCHNLEHEDMRMMANFQTS